MERAQEFVRRLAASMGVDPSVVATAGVSVKGSPARAENHVTAGYQLGEHFVITCDPAVESMLQSVSVDMEPSLDGWRALATANGGELLGAGRMQLLTDPSSLSSVDVDGYEIVAMRSDDPKALKIVERLVEVSTDDDLEEAEIDLADLDEVMHLAIGVDGEAAAYASACEFDLTAGYGDIGVLTRHDQRGKGLGVAVVSALSTRLFGEGIEPLYRCDEENAGSMRLSASMGFVPATRLIGFRFSE